MTHPHTLSIIVPVYYNETSLEELHRRLMQIAAALAPMHVELIFVDDGSGDQSFAVLKGLAATQPTMRVVKLARNFGSNAAILAGISQATGDAVAFVSADLQDPPELLVQMAQAWQAGNKVVFTVRANRDDPLVSRWLAEAFNALFHRLVLRDAPPTGVGFFLVDKQVAGLLLACEERNANLINLIVWLGFRPHQILYDRSARQFGRSRWTLSKRITYAIDTFVAFSYLPIRLASLTGITFALLGALAIADVVYAHLFLGAKVEGWASLMIVLLVVSGVQLTILGVLGEYLWRTLDQTRRRPIFAIDKIVEGKAASGTAEAERQG